MFTCRFLILSHQEQEVNTGQNPVHKEFSLKMGLT
jgi:hypothetical protein